MKEKQKTTSKLINFIDTESNESTVWVGESHRPGWSFKTMLEHFIDTHHPLRLIIKWKSFPLAQARKRVDALSKYDFHTKNNLLENLT
jgi:hypothetical protein